MPTNTARRRRVRQKGANASIRVRVPPTTVHRLHVLCVAKRASQGALISSLLEQATANLDLTALS